MGDSEAGAEEVAPGHDEVRGTDDPERLAVIPVGGDLVFVVDWISERSAGGQADEHLRLGDVGSVLKQRRAHIHAQTLPASLSPWSVT